MDIEKFNYLIGKTLNEAKDLTSFKVRAVVKEGQPFVITNDFRMDRINVELDSNSKITKIVRFG